MFADRLEALLQDHVAAGDVPGLTWLAADGDVVRRGSLGTSDLAGTRPVTPDAIFRISSLSKPIVSTAAMVLVDAGQLALDDPIDRWLPELAGRRVLRTADSGLDDTVPADRALTVHDLLTSTMGIGWDFGGPGPQTVMQAIDDRGLSTTPPAPARWRPADEWLRGLHTLPLQFQPGERWLYHTSYDVLGALVARVAGQSLGSFLDEALFGPLGMVDTAFSVPPAKRARFGDCFGDTDAAGRGVYDPTDGQWASPPRFESGGGGLVSTVADYFAFADMLRRGGRGILSAPSILSMTSNHLSPTQLAASAPEADGITGWGFGMSVQIGPEPGGLPAGAYGWDGGLGSVWRTDPVGDRVAILLTNQAFMSPEPVAIVRSFRSAFGA